MTTVAQPELLLRFERLGQVPPMGVRDPVIRAQLACALNLREERRLEDAFIDVLRTAAERQP
jgi:hypothetical protein